METSLGTAIVESKVGLGDGYLDITVVDPTAITGDDYKVTFDASLPDGTEVVNWTLTNVTTGVELIKNNTIQAGIEMVTKDNVGVDAIGVTEGFRVGGYSVRNGKDGFFKETSNMIRKYNTNEKSFKCQKSRYFIFCHFKTSFLTPR